jgi:peptidoglycan/LPS O-acetylase OafA/YrhL
MNRIDAPPQRRYELDWLRVIAIFLVFVFHSGRFFDPTDWHIKYPVTYPELATVGTFVILWMMPLVFVISGASVFYAAGKSGSGRFLQSKVSRLLIPVVVGIFTHIPLQVYLERVTHHQFHGSFWAFVPHYFKGIYGSGNGNFAIQGMHLWYLLVLFIFTLLFAPVFRWLRGASGQKTLRAAGDFLALPGAVYLLAAPVALLMNVLNPRRGVGAINLGGWSILIYTVFFLGGFFIYSHAGLLERVKQMRWLSLLGGAVCLAFLMQQISSGVPAWSTSRYQLLSVFYAVSSWCWVLTFLGFGQKYLTAGTPFLRRANEAILPFYIMHQTVLLVVGYYVVRWSLNAGLTYLVIAGSSLIIIVALYELLVRRFNLLRVLFGMKPLPRKVVAPDHEPAFVGK